MIIARDALQTFYAQENLPADGNQNTWIDWVTVFDIPVPLPNVFGRTKVLPYHDLHHIVTGYHADEVGECEIGAWTLATNGGPLLGDVYDTMTTLLGLIRFRERTLAAWRRGRQCRNLYGYELDELLELNLTELHRLVGTAPC